jgi:MFS family permease
MPVWQICLYLAIMGVGLGMAMQILILIVQNTFPNSEVGTATASNNYFRQIGASIGSAVVGSIFVANLKHLVSTRLPHVPGTPSSGGSLNSFTPAKVQALPEAIKHIIVGAYNDALTPVFLYMVPLMLIATVLLFFVKEKPLATTIEREQVLDLA